MRRPGARARAHRRNTVRAMLMTGVISMKYFTERVRWDYRTVDSFNPLALLFARREFFSSTRLKLPRDVTRCGSVNEADVI